jgi:hypothetical protein
MRHRHVDLPLINGDGAARAASLRKRPASVPPLPPTLDVEGADQPFCLEIVAAHASILRGLRSWFIVREGYNVQGGLPGPYFASFTTSWLGAKRSTRLSA